MEICCNYRNSLILTERRELSEYNENDDQENEKDNLKINRGEIIENESQFMS
jgi:hypothetical protein